MSFYCNNAARDGFDNLVAHYKESFRSNYIARLSRQHAWGLYDIAFSGCKKIADLGCGPGLDAEYLSERGVQVIALDNSPKMLREMEKTVNCNKDNLKQIITIQADLNDPSGSDRLHLHIVWFLKKQ